MISFAREPETADPLPPEIVTIVAAMRARDRTQPSREPKASKPRKRPPKPQRPPGEMKPSKLNTLIQSGFRCVYCGTDLAESPETLWAASVDHVRPRASGGKNNAANRVASCQICNQAKGCHPTASVDEVRPAVLARRNEVLRNLAAQMERQGFAFRRPATDSQAAQRQLEQVAMSLAQQADGLIETLARLEAMAAPTESEVVA